MLPVNAADDGLPYDEVGAWVEDKHRLVALYESLFSTGMKNKWERRVCIELFAGSGLAHIRESSRFLWGSPLLSLSVVDPFTDYVFCESDPLKVEALRKRVTRYFPERRVTYIEGDCNDRVEEICDHIPRGPSVLAFCFSDPFDLSIRFSTIRRVAQHRVDFLMLLALHMDANRNEANYLAADNPKIDDFLGTSGWRHEWRQQSVGTKFPRFLAEEYARSMEGIDYLPVPFDRMKQIRSDIHNLPLYHLALFSKHPLAYKYWEEVLKYSTPQRSLPF